MVSETNVRTGGRTRPGRSEAQILADHPKFGLKETIETYADPVATAPGSDFV